MKKMLHLHLIFLLMGILLFSSSCDNEETPEPVMVASSMSLESGNNQSMEVSKALTDPIIVIVKDQKGNPFAGGSVSVSVSGGSVSTTTLKSNSEGKASVNWTMGTNPGEQTMTLTAFSSDGTSPLAGSPIMVKAIATPAPPVATKLELVSGNGQTNIVEATLTLPIVVLVKDQYDMVFANATVSFEVASGSVSAASQQTDATGKAQVTWTLGSTEGTQTLNVSAMKSDGTTPLTGSPISVTATAKPNTVTDIVGNVYKVVEIGTQIWMAENLKTTKYNDGSLIPQRTGSEWWSDKDGSFCWYNNSLATNKELYGALYNWYAVDNKNLCPTAWHVPSVEEWETLESFLGSSHAGDKLKEAGSTHWGPSNQATNETGFTGLPGGYRSSSSAVNIGFSQNGFAGIGYWWSSTQDSTTGSQDYAYSRVLQPGISTFDTSQSTSHKRSGYSVRCVKD